MENKEINVKRNHAWKNSKGDGKSLWNLIDWKGSADKKKETLINESDITPYFRKIFQSEKTKEHPKLEDIADRLNSHNDYIPILDDPMK